MKRRTNSAETSSRCCTVAQRARRRRCTMIAGGGVVSLVLMTAVVAAVALLQPPAPIGLVAVGSDYADNLSVKHNAYGWNGLLGVLRLSSTAPTLRHGVSIVQAEPRPLEAGKHFEWSKATAEMTAPTALLVVSLHGGADEQGAYCLRSTCSPNESLKERLRITDLIAELRKLPADQRKVVVFEATTAPGDWRYGEAENRFAEGLRALNAEVEKTPNLVFVSASDQGQQSWPEGATGRTVFLHTLIEGVRGAAKDANDDGRLDAAELLTHVRATVAARVSVTRQRRQTPLVLPLGAEGEVRCRNTGLGIAASRYAPEAVELPALSKEAIAQSWEKASQLEADLQRPEATATVAWRRYQRMLLRHEQLLLAGATASAADVYAALEDLEAKLRRETSARGRFSDPVQLDRPGAGSPLVSQADAVFAKLWKATPADRTKLANAAINAVSPSEQTRVRRLLYDRTLVRLQDDPVGNLTTAVAILRAVGDPIEPLPSEAHLAVMLAAGLPHDLSDPAWRDALRLAIGVRQLSEGALATAKQVDHSLTPALLPWLRDRFSEADRHRLVGEDMLFGGAEYLGRATDELQQAQSGYVKLQQDVAKGVRALRVRNAAFEDLPFYTESVASQRATSEATRREIVGLAQAVERAWGAAHGLGDLLLSADTMPTMPDSTLDAIAEKTEAVQKQLDSLRDDFRQWRANLITRTGAAYCNNRPAALLLPDLEVGERLKLLATCPPNAERAATSQQAMQLRDRDQQAWRRDETRRGVRLALATIGERVYERNVEGRGVYKLAIKQTDESTGPLDSLAQECAEVRNKLLAGASMVQGAGADSQATARGREAIANAAAAVRRLDEGVLARLAPTLLDELRRLRRYDYYLWRADRVIQSGWNGADEGDKPYYERAGLAYLRLAERTIPGRRTTDRMRREATTPLTLQLETPKRLDVVSDVAPPIPLSLKGTSKSGYAAITLEVSDGFQLITPQAGERLLCPLRGASDDGLMTALVGVDPQHAASAATPSVLNAKAWFRGSWVLGSTAVTRYTEPDIEIDSPPRPPGAGLAIIDARPGAQRSSDGAVAFVLDASGSMGPTSPGATSKYDEAVSTLRALLADTPAGVRVSVWVFGQAIGPNKTADSAEATIERVVDPTPWDPTDRSLLTRVIDRLATPRVQPWNESPLARTLLEASRDLRGVPGYKAVVAITDGVDNRFAGDTYTNPRGQSVGEVMRQELAGSGVAVHVVGFRVVGAEQDAARRQFGFLGQLSPAGKWWEASQRSQLEGAIRQALGDQGSIALYLDSATAVSRPTGRVKVTAPGTPPAWQDAPLDAGVYDLPVADSGTSRQQTLLSDGDLLLLTTRSTVNGAVLAPASYSALRHPRAPAVETGEWRVALLNHRLLPTGGTSSLLAIEQFSSNKQADASSLLQWRRPVDLWVEGNQPAARLACRRVDGYPAPCWVLDSSADAAASGEPERLTVWWSWPNDPAPTLALRRAKRQESLTDWVGKSWNLEGDRVVLRQLAVESRVLPDLNGKLTEQSCVVVELGGESLCKVRLHGVDPAGQRHRWFREAGAMVSVFWPVTADQLRAPIDGLDLVSVAGMKRQSEAAGQVARFHGIATASPDDQRPAPAVDWYDAPQAN